MKPLSFIVPENLLLSDLNGWSKVIREDAMERGQRVCLSVKGTRFY
jgi:hypothetical protein